MFKNIEGKTHGVLLEASCFEAGTLVHTALGPVQIERLREGDLVLSADLGTGLIDAQPVLSVHRAAPVPTIRLRIAGEDITTTASHPFYRPGVGWMRAGDLRVSDPVKSRGGPVAVRGITSGDACPVYNLRVDGGHTYFVGHAGLLVHDGSPFAQSVGSPR
jgi:hypothetical protein